MRAVRRVDAAGLTATREEVVTGELRQVSSFLVDPALGTNFADEDSLFVEHTLLVVSAEIIAHAVVGIDPVDPALAARALVEGRRFEDYQIGGVVEADFFDWLVEAPDGERFVKGVARRLACFDWGRVEHEC